MEYIKHVWSEADNEVIVEGNLNHIEDGLEQAAEEINTKAESDHDHALADAENNGFMSAEDKTILDSINEAFPITQALAEALNERADALADNINDNANGIAENQDSITALQTSTDAQITALKTSVDTLNSTLSNLQSAVDELNTNMSDVIGKTYFTSQTGNAANKDADDLTTMGVYNINSGTLANCPLTNGFLLVFVTSANTFMQVAVPYGSDGTIYVRVCWYGTMYDWKSWSIS